MRRRDFIKLIGGVAVASPLGARAQQRTPVIGFLSGGTEGPFRPLTAAFHRGLGEPGSSRGATSRFYIVGRRRTVIDCPC
jgi:putative tryptophan/tyrosine transport system substrate-binding protein